METPSLPALQIRRCTPADLDTLLRIGRNAFWQTFSSTNHIDDMQDYMSKAFRPDVFAREIAHPDSWFFLASVDEQPAGYLKINFAGAQTDVHDPRSLEVERLYVLGGFQGMGIGQALLTEALSIAQAQGLESVWLGVWEHNYKAQAFYEKNGFAVFGSHPFRMGQDPQIDLLMRKSLQCM